MGRGLEGESEGLGVPTGLPDLGWRNGTLGSGGRAARKNHPKWFFGPLTGGLTVWEGYPGRPVGGTRGPDTPSRPRSTQPKMGSGSHAGTVQMSIHSMYAYLRVVKEIRVMNLSSVITLNESIKRNYAL